MKRREHDWRPALALMLWPQLGLAGSVWPVDYDVLASQPVLPCREEERTGDRPSDVATWTMTFDSKGRLTARDDGADEAHSVSVVQYRYDAGGRLASVESRVYGDTEATTFTRDAKGREVRREQVSGDGSTFVLARSYDADGTVHLGAMAPGAVGSEVRRFADGHVVELISGSLRQTYTYEGARLATMQRWDGAVVRGTKSFSYDEQGRLARTAFDLRNDGTRVFTSEFRYDCR